MNDMAQIIAEAARKSDAAHWPEAAAIALAAAGFGLVREAQAVALEEAADENAVRSDTLLRTMQNMADSREYELADIVRYGAFSAEAKAMESRLRARARTVRGGE